MHRPGGLVPPSPSLHQVAVVSSVMIIIMVIMVVMSSLCSLLAIINMENISSLSAVTPCMQTVVRCRLFWFLYCSPLSQDRGFTFLSPPVLLASPLAPRFFSEYSELSPAGRGFSQDGNNKTDSCYFEPGCHQHPPLLPAPPSLSSSQRPPHLGLWV